MKLKLTIATMCLCASSAWATQIGEITLAGTFTTNHLYDFNHPGQSAFGWFNGPVTAQSATGIFAPYVSQGTLLGMASNQIWTNETLPLFNIGGFNLVTTLVIAAGPDGSFLFGVSSLTGHGFDPNGYPAPAGGGWSFHELGINQLHDQTGQITMTIEYGYTAVPDTGYTVLLFIVALITIAGFRYLSQNELGRFL
jgi:hypothetical protein